MGHRALVAYRRADALFDVHYSHWGAEDFRLVDRISLQTPFGSEGRKLNAPEYFFSKLGYVDDSVSQPEIDAEVNTDADLEAVTLEQLCDELETRRDTEAIYVVTVTRASSADEPYLSGHSTEDIVGNDKFQFDIRAFLPVRVEVKDTIYGTLLYAPSTNSSGKPLATKRLKGWVRGLKTAYEERVDNDTLFRAVDGCRQLVSNTVQRAGGRHDEWILADSTAVGSDYCDKYPVTFMPCDRIQPASRDDNVTETEGVVGYPAPIGDWADSDALPCNPAEETDPVVAESLS